jgi:hypothetical protein
MHNAAFVVRPTPSLHPASPLANIAAAGWS